MYKKTRKEKKNEQRRNQYARVRRYKITSTLGLLVRGDPQNKVEKTGGYGIIIIIIIIVICFTRITK